MLSSRVLSINPSISLLLNKQAKDLIKQGIKIIRLGVGEPDFDTPDHIKFAGIQAIVQGRTRYTSTDGTPELKAAIQNKLDKENDLHYSPDEIIVSNGAKQVIFNLMMATLNPGDEVIIPAPYWLSYPDMVKIAGGVPVIVDCGKSFKITAELLAQNITPKTKWLILNSPNNPTGACYDEAELRAIAQVLQDNAKVHVLSDEIYEHIVFDEYKHISIGNFLPKDQVFVVNGVSKSHAMTGWRIGYGAGKAEIIKAMVAVQSQSTSNPCSISQAAAVEALNGCQDNIERQTEVYRQKRDLAYNLLKQSDSLHLNKPPGAFYLFIDARDFIAKNNMSGSGEFCKFLLDKAKVATVPGAAFGMEGYFRISFASSFDEIRQGCEQILAACK